MMFQLFEVYYYYLLPITLHSGKLLVLEFSDLASIQRKGLERLK